VDLSAVRTFLCPTKRVEVLGSCHHQCRGIDETSRSDTGQTKNRAFIIASLPVITSNPFAARNLRANYRFQVPESVRFHTTDDLLLGCQAIALKVRAVKHMAEM
jgi:hypothetical protein